MSLLAFRWGIFVFTLIAAGAWGAVLFTVDPEAAGMAGGLLFFGSFSAWMLGLWMLLLLWAYIHGIGAESTVRHLGGVTRQALLLDLFVTGNLFFLYRGLWVWWMSLLFFSFILLLEFTYRSLSGKPAA